MDRRRRPLLAACLVLTSVSLAGCSGLAQAAPNEERPPAAPAQLRPLAGTGRSEVILTADAAKRVGLTTEPIAAASTPAGKSVVPPGRSVIPLAAVLYDKDGKTWVYAVRRPLTYDPVQVVIAHVDGETATLSSGPPVGTQVVTVAGAELLGAEYGVPGEQ